MSAFWAWWRRPVRPTTAIAWWSAMVGFSLHGLMIGHLEFVPLLVVCVLFAAVSLEARA